MGVESHKSSDARGVQLFTNNGMGSQVEHGIQLTGADGSAVQMPTIYTVQTWIVPETADIIVANTNGCHIYFIEATVATDDQTTIKEHVSQHPANSQYVDLMGRKVVQPSKGIYVRNGRKIVVR
jgi:hypothetical protein